MRLNFYIILCCLIVRNRCDDVLVFTDDDFDHGIREHDIVLVKFFSPGCGHCQALAPEFEKAAAMLRFNNPVITLAEVDCTTHGRATCNKYEVRRYPTMKVFSNGELSYAFDGPRDADGIVGFMKMKVNHVLEELNTLAEFDACLNELDNVIIGFFENRDSDIYKVFQKLLESQRNHYRFAITYSNKLMMKYGFRNDVVLFRSEKLATKLEQSQIRFEGKPTLYEIRSWVTSTYHGLVGFRTQKNKEQFEAPFVVVYCDVEFSGKPTDTRYWRNRVMNVAKKYTQGKRRVTFSLSDAKEFRQELLDFSLDPLGAKPLVTARDAQQQRFALRADFSMEALEQFVDDLLSGSLKVFVKSDPVPEENSGLVKVVVRTNFNEIVNDQTKDVLLALDAPWCEVCKNVVEKLEEVAEKLKDEGDIVIAKMDVTSNDLPRPFYVKGYPSLYLAPKRSKEEPKLYQGGFTVRDFIQFLAAEATDPLHGYDRKGQRVKQPPAPEKTEL